MAIVMKTLRKDGSEVQVKDRVSSEGHYGTIRFFGCLPETKGTWFGIEWDEPDRGKHDGSHNGHRYFSTSHPTSGSFVKEKKLDFGMSCFDAIVDRYGKIEDENAGVITEELYVVGNNKKTVVEMVGAKSVNLKQSQLNQLREVVLRGSNVYGVGDKAESLVKLTPNISELDLSLTLIPSWHHVAEICKCLQQLYSLNVSNNRLELPDSSLECSHLNNIKVLYLNRMCYSWDQILQCCQMFPCLESLHTCFNNLESIYMPQTHLQNLKLINLESNSVHSWDQILLLDNCPKLESLILNDNQIESIYFPDVELGNKSKIFVNVKSIYINRNKISQWNSINELDKLENFEDLQINGNPLLETTSPETSRQLLIAKIARLDKCQRTEVTDEERRGAEIDYLKRFGQEWLKSGGSQDPANNNPSQEFQISHPRFLGFIQAYGPPENSEMGQKPQKLKDSLISLQILNPDDDSIKTLQKKLPGTMTVQKLKALVRRIYKIDSEIKLSYLSKKMQGKEIEFDNDLRTLVYYSIEPGDSVYARWS